MFSSLVLGFPRRRFRVLLECHRVVSKSPTPYSWEHLYYPGTTWAITSKEDHALLRISRRNNFLSTVQNQGGADQANWTPCRCLHGPRTFNSGWISLKTSRPMPQTDSSASLSPTHVGKHFFNFFIYNLNSISPGSSHPSIQRGARPLTGDLPTTAPSPMTFEFWKLFPNLMYCLWLYLPIKCWVLAQHVWNIKIS